jgi:tetratricopeptide (TPR) repeat protein
VETPEALFAQLDAGYPVLVMQNLAFSFWPQWHFAVAIGYENDGERIVLHTGTDRADGTHWNRFVRTWARADYRGMVVMRPGELPANAKPRELVRALNDLQASAGPEAARPYWQAAVEQWPDHYLVQFGQGNLQWALDEKEDAIQSFRKAGKIRPDAASAWNNLAEAWRQTGCRERARAAIEKAFEIAPQREAIRDTRDQIKTMNESRCTVDLSDNESP